MLGEKKALSFPIWLEVVFIAGLLSMAAVEYTHDNWAWAGIFGVSGLAFAASLIARTLMGSKKAD